MYEAWIVERKPIYSRLPDCYKEGDPDISAWLVGYWDELLIDTKTKIDDFPRQLNPAICDVEYLDFLAPILGWTKQYWDKTYSEKSKRLLLSNSWGGRKIWEAKGSAGVLSFVLDSLGIKNKVMEQGDFLVGITAVGQPLGQIPWQFNIFLPTLYQNTFLQRRAERIAWLFSPAWCFRNIVFEDANFTVNELLQITENGILATQDDRGIVING